MEYDKLCMKNKNVDDVFWKKTLGKTRKKSFENMIHFLLDPGVLTIRKKRTIKKKRSNFNFVLKQL